MSTFCLKCNGIRWFLDKKWTFCLIFVDFHIENSISDYD